MALIKTKEEIEILKESGKRLATILEILKKESKPGISAKHLDDLALDLIKKGGDEPAFLNYRGSRKEKPYPATLCVSVNEELVHTLPRPDKIFKNGDIVSLDLGVIHKGLITDSAVTFGIGKISSEAKSLMKATKTCLEKGIKAVKVGGHIGDIGFAVEKEAKKSGFAIAKGLAGHSVGHEVHEEPLVPNTGRKGEGMKIQEGMVLAIEPMLCVQSGEIFLEKDGFTIRSKNKKLCAHFEHTIAVTEKGVVVLTKK